MKHNDNYNIVLGKKLVKIQLFVHTRPLKSDQPEHILNHTSIRTAELIGKNSHTCLNDKQIDTLQERIREFSKMVEQQFKQHQLFQQQALIKTKELSKENGRGL